MFEVDYTPDRLKGATEALGDGFERVAFSAQAPRGVSLLGSQPMLRPPLRDALKHRRAGRVFPRPQLDGLPIAAKMPGHRVQRRAVAEHAFRFTELRGSERALDRRSPAFGVHVERVVLRCANEQMLRVRALGVVAAVQHILAGRDGADEHQPRGPVGAHLAWHYASPRKEHAIATAFFGPAPAPAVGAGNGKTHEPFGEGFAFCHVGAFGVKDAQLYTGTV